jgi:hypothetical protein
MNVMDKNKENIELLADKALVENLFSKQALDNYKANQLEMPEHYFEQFGTQVLSKVAEDKKAKTIRFTIPKWGQIAIAASFFAIIASTYLWIESKNTKTDVASNISIQDIATSEIDAYVNENEAMAEIDWQAEINKESSNLENLNTHLIKDSNNTQ